MELEICYCVSQNTLRSFTKLSQIGLYNRDKEQLKFISLILFLLFNLRTRCGS